jgi:hypothetical protein
MRVAQKKIAISVVLLFGPIFATHVSAQDADDPQKLAVDVSRSEDEALAGLGQDLTDLGDRTERAMKDELRRDSAEFAGLQRAPTSSREPTISGIPASDDSRKELEREVDSLEEQSRELAK